METTSYLATDTFGDTMRVQSNDEGRVSFEIHQRQGRYPHMMCLSKAETILLRDALLKIAPLPATQDVGYNVSKRSAIYADDDGDMVEVDISLGEKAFITTAPAGEQLQNPVAISVAQAMLIRKQLKKFIKRSEVQ